MLVYELVAHYDIDRRFLAEPGLEIAKRFPTLKEESTGRYRVGSDDYFFSFTLKPGGWPENFQHKVGEMNKTIEFEDFFQLGDVSLPKITRFTGRLDDGYQGPMADYQTIYKVIESESHLLEEPVDNEVFRIPKEVAKQLLAGMYHQTDD